MKKVETGKTIVTRLFNGRGRILSLPLSLSVLLFAAYGLWPAALQAEVPVKFTYQGNLRQAGFLANGNRRMVFRIYDSSVSATELWTSPEYTVSVSTGVFRVALEPASLNWQSGSFWLELQVEGNRMSPREEITSSPYAINALLHSGKKYTTTNNGVAPGSPAEGDLWMDVATHTLKFWNGTSWVSTAGSGAAVGDNLGNHVATTTLDMAGFPISNAGAITGSLITATGSGISAVQLRLANNVLISSEASANLGGGVRVSSNVYIVGFASATKFYGDGSGLTNIAVSGDNLGNHTATTDLNMSGRQIYGVSTLTGDSALFTGVSGVEASRVGLSPNVALSSAAQAEYGGVYSSSHVFVNGDLHAVNLYGNGSGITGITGAGDNLGNHVATTTLNMAGNQIINVSSVTVTGLVDSNRIRLNTNVELSSAAQANYGGVYASSHVFVNGNLYAVNLYGNGSGLTGITGTSDNLGNHVATTTLNMAGHAISNAGAVTATAFIGNGSQLTNVAGTMGTYTGATANTYDGNRGGYAGANALCAAEYPGSHICTNAEILFSINSGNFASFPSNTTLWISNGPPGFTVNANDCVGWTSVSPSAYGAVWNKEAAGDGFGSLNKCGGATGHNPRKFACCIQAL